MKDTLYWMKRAKKAEIERDHYRRGYLDLVNLKGDFYKMGRELGVRESMYALEELLKGKQK